MRVMITRQADGGGILRADGVDPSPVLSCAAPAGHYPITDLAAWDALGIRLTDDAFLSVLEIGLACAKVIGNEPVTLDISDPVAQVQTAKSVRVPSPASTEEPDHG